MKLKKKLVPVNKFNPNLKISEGANCYATCNALELNIINNTV